MVDMFTASATTVTAVVGNPKPRSRTLLVAEAVAAHLASAVAAADVSTIDLADHGSRLLDWDDQSVTELQERVAHSSVAVFASPTYKGTYTGLLKIFLDRFGSGGLSGVVAVPVMVGAAPAYAMAPEVFLRPLLTELGASVPCRSLFVLESQLPDLEMVVSGWGVAAGRQVARSAGTPGGVSAERPRSNIAVARLQGAAAPGHRELRGS